MKIAEKKVIDNAVRWWLSHRPSGYNELDHIENPSVNCTTETERILARSVAVMLIGKKPEGHHE